MSCNFRFELRVGIFCYFLKQMVSEIKRPPLLKDLDPPLRYMYIVVQCGLSSIVEYGTAISVVDCVQLSVSVNKCVRPSCTLGGSTYHEEKNPGTHPIKYHFCSMRLSFVVSQYVLCTLGNSHYCILRMLLPCAMNKVYMVVGLLKYTKAL
jgi:hypothetical protein